MLSTIRHQRELQAGMRSTIFFSTLWCRLSNLPAFLALPSFHIIFERIDSLLNLCAKVGTVKRSLVNDSLAVRTVPSQSIDRIFWPSLF